MRPAHIHGMVTGPGHPSRVTELFFEGDPHLDDDAAEPVKPDLTHRLKRRDGVLWLEHEFVLGD